MTSGGEFDWSSLEEEEPALLPMSELPELDDIPLLGLGHFLESPETTAPPAPTFGPTDGWLPLDGEDGTRGELLLERDRDGLWLDLRCGGYTYTRVRVGLDGRFAASCLSLGATSRVQGRLEAHGGLSARLLQWRVLPDGHFAEAVKFRSQPTGPTPR